MKNRLKKAINTVRGAAMRLFVSAHSGEGYIDTAVKILIAVVILAGTWQLLAESVRMSMDAVPESIDPDEIVRDVEALPGVCGIHHLHIWPISTTETAMTAHLVVEEKADPESVVHEVKHKLREHGIHHATLETEREGHACTDEPDCSCR